MVVLVELEELVVVEMPQQVRLEQQEQ